MATLTDALPVRETARSRRFARQAALAALLEQI
jgi:hypothetical protein